LDWQSRASHEGPVGTASRFAVVIALAGAGLAAQAPQQPTFRARVDLVQVDATVLDDARRPVRGLKATDFTLLENGLPREVVAFTEMHASDPSHGAG
jgi:hypothetical protein